MMTESRSDIQSLMSKNLTPDAIRWGNSVDWRFFGDFDKGIYEPETVVDRFTDQWEAKVAMILQKHSWGMWIIDGPRGSGKTCFAVSTAFYYKVLYGRPIASNFPLKRAFGDYRLFNLNDIRDQLERLRMLPKMAGTADWKAVDLAKYGIWLPRTVCLDDEFHKEANKRRPGTDEILVISELINEIRHYEALWLGLTPDKEQLDAKRVDNDLFISTEVRCAREVDEKTKKHYVRGIIYSNEDINGQRVGTIPDSIRYDVARFCNLYWTQGVGTGGTKLEKRPKGKKHEPTMPPDMVETAEAEGIETGDSAWEILE